MELVGTSKATVAPLKANSLKLGTIIAALHDSEINGGVSWFFDRV